MAAAKALISYVLNYVAQNICTNMWLGIIQNLLRSSVFHEHLKDMSVSSGLILYHSIKLSV